MNKTNIEYLDYTWNPIAMRCTPVSEGCAHCWHLDTCERLRMNPKIKKAEAEAYAGHEAPLMKYDELQKPLRKRGSLRIGVQFMGDLFYEGIDFGMIHAVFDMMWKSFQHTFLVLTKRPERMFEFMTQQNIKRMYGNEWPLPNVWLGVTVESDKYLWRIGELLKIPAAVRWVSYEPGLGPVDLDQYLFDPDYCCWNCGLIPIDGNNVHDHILDVCPRCNASWDGKRHLDWVVCGGESGPGARPMHPDWVRSVRDQCKAAGVPFFFKQWGEYEWRSIITSHMGTVTSNSIQPIKVGKGCAGRLLDGREWLEYPK